MFLLIIILNCCVFKARSQTHYHYVDDRTSRNDKLKLMMVAKELIMDAYTRIRQVAGIRDKHSHDDAFAIGLIMGNIREKYRRMLETYREMRDQNNGRNVFVPASLWRLRPIHYIVAMEQVHELETDIDKLIHILENIISDALHPDPRYLYTTPSAALLMARLPRVVGEETKNEEVTVGKEESLKSKNRETQLLRRIGATVQHTSLPRFQQQWPVEETWRLGQYGDLKRYY